MLVVVKKEIYGCCFFDSVMMCFDFESFDPLSFPPPLHPSRSRICFKVCVY